MQFIRDVETWNQFDIFAVAFKLTNSNFDKQGQAGRRPLSPRCNCNCGDGNRGEFYALEAHARIRDGMQWCNKMEDAFERVFEFRKRVWAQADRVVEGTCSPAMN
jgi:hypothetical protein